MEQGLIAACGVELGYTDVGSGPATVVLLHDWPQTSHAWRKVLPLLAPRLRCVAFDLRGVGHSSPAGTGFDKATMAEDVYAAVESLQIERPPLLVGHGIGGMVG